MQMIVTLTIVGVMSLVATALLGRRTRGRDTPADRWLTVAFPFLIFLAVCTVLIGATTGHHIDWDAARLAAAVAAARGLPVYAPDGAIETVMYPPGWLLAYRPVAWGQTPAAVLAIGNGLALFYSLLPVAALALLRRSRPLAGLSLAALFVFGMLRCRPLYESCFFPHADAPAMGLALVAAGLLWRSRQPSLSAKRAFWSSAVFAALAVACKQTMILIIPAMAAWLCLRQRYRAAGAYVGISAVIGLVLLAVSAWQFGFEGLWLNLVAIPGRQGWVGSFPFNGFRVLAEFLDHALLPITLLIAGCACAVGLAKTGGPRRQVTEHAWGLLVCVAIFLVPVALLGRVKVGGALNAFGPAIYFLYAAGMALAIDVFRSEPSNAGDDRAGWVALRAAVGMGVLAVCGVWTLNVIQELRYGLPPMARSRVQQAYDYIRAGHPGTYFPAYPLAHLLAQGELYHYAHAIGDRELRGHVPLAPGQAQRYMPRDLELVCWTRAHLADERKGMGNRLKEYRRPVLVPELPEFICFRQASPVGE
jgi:hypothetical protein